MHIEESATHQLGEASRQCARRCSQQEQIQTPEALVNQQQCQADSFKNMSMETPLQIALANCESVSGVGFQSQLLAVTNAKHESVFAMTTPEGEFGVWEWNRLDNSFDFEEGFQGKSLGQLMFGYEPAEIPDYQTFLRLIHTDDLPRVCQTWQNYLENRTPVYEVEFRILTKSAGWKWIAERGKAIESNATGQPVRIIGTLQDITKEKFRVAALHQHEMREQLLKRVREIIDSSSPLSAILQTIVKEVGQFLNIEQVVIYRIDPNSDLVALNSLAPLNVNNGEPCCCSADLVTPILRLHSAKEVSSMTDDTTDGETNFWGMLIAHNCGNKRDWQEWEIDTLKQVSREVGILIARSQLLQQIQTEVDTRQVAETLREQLERIQKQLLDNEKLSSIGQLFTNLVKEIYNPVSFIDDTLYRVSQYAEDLIQVLEYQHHYNLPPTATASPINLDLDFVKTDFMKLLWSMRAGSERLKATVFALHNFSHDDNGQIKKTDLHTGLDNTLTILQHRLKEQPSKPGIQVIRKFGEIPLVKCFPSELNQVFMNILTNAIEALEERMKYDYSFVPQICISTKIIASHLSLVASNEIKFIDKQPTSAKQKIIIRISDNGTGILPHIKRRIFEPFFTTKPIGSKGLGLSISEEIIQKHHGKLRYNSQLGQGTEFIIEINTTAKRYTDIRKPAIF